jgi:hypothetical protein
MANQENFPMATTTQAPAKRFQFGIGGRGLIAFKVITDD